MKTYDYLHQGLGDGKGAYHADQQAPLRAGDLVRVLVGVNKGTLGTIERADFYADLYHVGAGRFYRAELQGPLDPETA